MRPDHPPRPEGPLGGVVRRLQLSKVHREIKDDLNRFGLVMAIVIAVHVQFELPAIADDPETALLKRDLHVSSGAVLMSSHRTSCSPVSVFFAAGCSSRTRRPILSVVYSSRIAAAMSSAQRRRMAESGSSHLPFCIAQSAIALADAGHG